MPRNTEKQARAEAMLGELAELGLMLARDLAVQARAAEDPEEKVALVAAFQKTSRAVRLTLALDFKLGREAACEARQDQEIAERREAAAQAEAEACAPEDPVEQHGRRVRGVLNRLLWTESEGDEEEFDVLRRDLDVRLSEAARLEGFTDIPVEVLAHRLKADMRLGGDLVVTTAARLAANTSAPPLADTG
ncbi:hypothetical protein [Phenylobacterium sp.]|uniref:hypothetical protein n=1 Tax=Phenylobacterium sp. TaxID=1871053 RepID=UPI0011FE4E38|nr:hypothetical protein [Phenylobacterium sp.]THD59135.1 MAG: hypothetical protein E8A49_17180 [Phenylobacterium sp.]